MSSESFNRIPKLSFCNVKNLLQFLEQFVDCQNNHQGLELLRQVVPTTNTQLTPKFQEIVNCE